ncbi:MAG: hypothetical protein H0X31_01015 [Nostocaceae cyanobacterium]|nr:hypothetical protein [Nostocaceae cyanobacterium]
MSRATEADESTYNGSYSANQVYAYYLKNNLVNLLPVQSGAANGSLRFVYFIRPSGLVPSSQVAVVKNIDRTTGIITFQSLPSAYSNTTPVDFYKFRSPHTIMGIDVKPTSVASTQKTMTFNPADIPMFLAVGDHVPLAEQCCIPQIPSDLHVFLAQKTAERILESQGDLEGLQAAQAKSKEMEFRAGTIIDNRVDSSPTKLANRRGILTSGLYSRRRRG